MPIELPEAEATKKGEKMKIKIGVPCAIHFHTTGGIALLRNLAFRLLRLSGASIAGIEFIGDFEIEKEASHD